jgi:hypothetical protein
LEFIVWFMPDQGASVTCIVQRKMGFRSELLALIFVALSFVTFVDSTQADQSTPDTSAQDALKQTQDLLRNASARQQAIKGNPTAEQADARVRNLAGPETQAIYDLSADVMGKIVNDASGDPAKMQELLNKAMENPSAFAAQLPEAQKEKLRSIASKIESKQSAIPKPK